MRILSIDRTYYATLWLISHEPPRRLRAMGRMCKWLKPMWRIPLPLLGRCSVKRSGKMESEVYKGSLEHCISYSSR
ncbi:hypothetical protein HID58_055516 [Brassica napus]|uniref:Uncharacterized protein n=1 Tax=Brassica napus TaxID=3708 RepID=A0ABQ8AKJ2_BRANA|nr:hypothetical protein HID58_055516 [Brassica napus]